MAAKVSSEQAPKAAARRLRAEILSLPPETCLGSEPELMERLGLGRSTLRQAARILEQEQLVYVRRGIGGGYFGRRPDASGVARAASLYLRLQNTSFLKVLHTANVINKEIMRLAALSNDAEKKARLRAKLPTWHAWTDAPPPVALLIQADQELTEIFAELADTPPLTLFLQTVFQFGLAESQRDIFGDAPDRRKEMARRRAQLIDAVLAGDSRIAALISERINEMVAQWVEDGEMPDRMPLMMDKIEGVGGQKD